MSDGYKLWEEQQVIAGGNMLLSKRSDNFLPLNGLSAIKLKVVMFGI